MKKFNRTVSVSLLSAMLATALNAQEGESSERRLSIAHQEKSPLFAALDLDGDGVISTEEIASAPESLAALDLNQDGQLTPQEIFRPHAREVNGQTAGRRIVRLREGADESGERRLIRSGGAEGEQRVLRARDGERSGVIKIACPIFNTLDVDGDGVVSADEIANSWMNLLALDADADGVLTLDEVTPRLE